MSIVAIRLSETPTHIPVMPRQVFDNNHDKGTLIPHNERKAKSIVIMVWPAPLMMPFAIDITEKKI
jgi:hypothetical protein